MPALPESTMRKTLLNLGFGWVILVSTGILASGQSDPQRFELGGQFAFAPGRWDPGFGGRFSYEVVRNLSLEAELNFFPRVEDSFHMGRKTQGLFGLKVGGRTDRFGLFGKARPGFMRFGRVFDCPGTHKLSCSEFAYAEFALDIGGVAEYYPSPRTLLRFDVGNTIIRFRDRKDFPFSPEFPTIPRILEGGTRHSLQLNLGIGVRF